MALSALLRGLALSALLVALVAVFAAPPAGATVAGREGRIVFVRANQIYTMAQDGTAVRKLTSAGQNYRPKYSPTGLRISYIHEDASGARNVFVMWADGSHKMAVTTSGTVHTTPVWSPNGRTLAFAQTDGTPFAVDHVFIVRTSAPFGAPTQLMVTPAGADTPQPISAYPRSSLAWSPNGADLAVVNGDSESSPDTGLHLVHGMNGATTADVARAAHPEDVISVVGGECCGHQDWSDLNYVPDGTLGWAVLDYGDEMQYSPPHATLRYPGFVSLLGDKAGAPSPAGTHMVFVRGTGGTPTIWTATMQGGQRKQIQANGYQPDWQPLH